MWIPISSFYLVNVTNVFIRSLVGLVGILHVAGSLIVHTESRFDNLLLEVKCEEHSHLVSERVALIELDISVDLESSCSLENVCLQMHQICDS